MISTLGALDLSPDLLEKANIGLWAFEMDEGCEPRLYVDDTVQELIGLDRQTSPEKTYRIWYEHVTRDSYALVNDAVKKMIGGEHAEVQYPWRRPDGQIMIVRCSGTRNPEYTKGIRIEGIHQDVTELLHFEKEELKRLDRQRILTDGLAREYYTVWLVDGIGEHSIQLFRSSGNYYDRQEVKRARENPTYKEAVTRNIKKSVYEEDQERVLKETSYETIVRETPEEGIYVVSYRRYNDEEHSGYSYHQACFARALDVDGTVNYVMAFRDADKLLREQVEQERRLQEALSMAESANRAKTTFLNSMSHDIRTPMNAIIGFTELAASHIDNRNRVRDYLSKISHSSDHLLSLINDVLDMSRIESGKMNIEEEEENLSEIIKIIGDIVQSEADSRNIDFTVDVVGIDDEYIMCDKLRLNQILLNVLSNAIKYTPEGGAVSMRVEKKGVRSSGYGIFEFAIKDNGIGMSNELLETIYEPFIRGRSTTVSGIEGTGLGMAISKNIIDMMGGDIEITSEPDKGTEVVITFDFVIDNEAKQAVKCIEDGEKTEKFHGNRILLVEDNELNREIGREILEMHGFVVDEAENGMAAVEKIRTAKAGDYNIVLMDIQMPVMDGYEATRQIRALGTEISKIPILATTANAFEEDRRAALDAGMNEHIPKPIKASALIDALAKYI